MRVGDFRLDNLPLRLARVGDLSLPLPPMEAELVGELPSSPAWRHE